MADEMKDAGGPLTVTTPAAAVQIDPQNPLPEPSFFWRRWIAVILAVVVLALVWYTASCLNEMQDADRLYSLTKLMVFYSALVLTYYFVAPSASELTNMIQTASIMKHSLSLAGSAPEMPQNQPGSGLGAPIRGSERQEGGFPVPPLSGLPSGSGGVVGPSDEDDAAPRGRS